MADLIDRDAVIKQIAETQDKVSSGIEDVTFYRAIKIIRNAPAVNLWISVEDALPEIGYNVLVTRQTESNTRYIKIASRQDDCWMDNTDKYGKPNPHQVIAWMPMPDAYEPPKE